MENPVKFSEREKVVIDLLLQGMSNKQIAHTLGVSMRTVEFHLSNIYVKLGVKSRSETIIMLGYPHSRQTSGITGDDLRDSTVTVPSPATDNGGKGNSLRRRRMSRKQLIYLLLGCGLVIGVLVFVIIFNINGNHYNPESSPLPPTKIYMPGSGRLSFVSFMDGELAIYSVNADGTALTRLTDKTMLIMNLALSPDGQKIAFDGCLNGSMSTDCPAGVSFEIFVMNADGTGLENISNNPSSDRFPSWSPSGEIAFSSNRSGQDEIYIMNVDGAGLKQVTTGETPNREPHWSTDGTWLAYHCTKGLDTQICIQKADGSGEVTKISGTEPVWSPTMSNRTEWLAYLCFNNSHSDICLVHPDGSGLLNLTNSPVDEISPTWSPDERWIAYQSNQGNEIALYITCPGCVNGSVPSRLTYGEGNAGAPAWSPDGTMIAFLLDGNLNIIGSDGSAQKQVAPNVIGVPVWQP